MAPFKVKICGLTRPKDALAAVELGADAIGLNFYEKSSRFVSQDQAKTISNAIVEHTKSSGCSAPLKIGVYVNKPVIGIILDVIKVGLDGIQFHGDERPSVVQRTKNAIGNIKSDPSTYCSTPLLIRAIRVDRNGGEAEIERVKNEIKTWHDSGADAILLDAAVPGEFGGTGAVLDWAQVPGLNPQLPLILAGGLTPENVQDAIEQSGVHAVDVASGVELEPGIKDAVKMRQFIDNAVGKFGQQSSNL